MPTEVKIEKPVPAPVQTKQEKSEAYAIRKLGKLVRVLLDKLVKYLGEDEVKDIEKAAGVDLNGDGKIGFARIRTLICMFVVGLIVTAAYAAEMIVTRYVAPEANDAVIELCSDEEDDTNDELQIIMNTDNDLSITFGGTERFNLTAAGVLSGITGLDYSGDWVGANDETMDNVTDAVIQFTFDDDAATLGTVKIESENAAANVAAGDELRVDFAAQNDATQEVTYARLVVDATDETDTTEDGTVEIWAYAAGTLTKILSIDAGGIDVADLDIENVGTLKCDTVEEDGTSGVAIEGMTLNDGTYSDSDGIMAVGRFQTSTITTTAYTVVASDYGSMILVNTNAAVAITLPANGAAAGSWVEFAVHSSATDDCAPTIATATADTLIGLNSTDSDSVTYATGHRIGAHCKFWSDGAFWHYCNLGPTTITENDSD